jgi:hypothetical protein
MADVVVRFLFAVVFTLILVPVMCVVTAPYILVRAWFRPDGYWTSVASGFRGVVKRTLDFGPDFLQP